MFNNTVGLSLSIGTTCMDFENSRSFLLRIILPKVYDYSVTWIKGALWWLPVSFNNPCVKFVVNGTSLSASLWTSFEQELGDKWERLYFRGLWYAGGVWVRLSKLYGSWNAVMKQNEWWMWGVCRHGILSLRWWRAHHCLWVAVHSTVWLDNIPRINWWTLP